LNKKKNLDIIAILLIALMAIMLTGYASASDDAPPPLPNTFSGEIKFNNSIYEFDARYGTSVKAFIDNESKGSSDVLTSGYYRIDVRGTYTDNSKKITFKINNVTSYQTAIFNSSNPPPMVLDLLAPCCEIVSLPGIIEIPTDPDNDQLFEDLNGNGKKDFNDVVVFFNYLEWIPFNEPVNIFDFNGNGRIDFNDIVKLFEKI